MPKTTAQATSTTESGDVSEEEPRGEIEQLTLRLPRFLAVLLQAIAEARAKRVNNVIIDAVQEYVDGNLTKEEQEEYLRLREQQRQFTERIASRKKKK